jgi:cold shock protein
MASGIVKWLDLNRGYGFIRPERGEDVSVHISAVQASGLQTLQEGQLIEFDIEHGRKGTARRQPATTAGRCVGLTRRPRLSPDEWIPPMFPPVLPSGRCRPSRSAALAAWASSGMTRAACAGPGRCG